MLPDRRHWLSQLARKFPGFAVYLLCLSTTVPSVAAQSPTTEVHFTIGTVNVSKNQTNDSLPARVGKIRLHALGEGEDLEIPARSGETLKVTLPRATSWKVRWDGADLWAPVQVLVVDPSSDPVIRQRIPAWSVGELTGTLVLKDDEEEPLPEKVTVRFESHRDPAGRTSPDQEPVPESRMDCPVDAEGRFRCELPATHLDLSVRAEGFVSHYFWDLAISENSSGSLGRLTLQRGASLVGRVEVAEGELQPPKCEVRLVPRDMPGSGPQGVRLQRTAVTGTVEADGFFHLGPLPAGSYGLEARQPGYAAARLTPIELYERAETRLREPLVLRRPVDVDITLEPAMDWTLNSWRVLVFRQYELTAGSETVYDGSMPETGVLRLTDQTPGSFTLSIKDSVGNSFLTHDFEVLIDDTLVPIELDLVLVTGRLKLGNEAVAGTLWFGGRHGIQHVQMEANSKGRFTGVLPRAGSWRVEVSAPEVGIESELHTKVGDRGDVTIQLPDTELTGRVVNAKGKPVPGAEVVVNGTDFVVNERSGEEGEFAVRGFQTGLVEVWARHRSSAGERWSGVQVMPVESSIPAGPVELRLGGTTRELHGRVVSDRGPVAGAQILVEPLEVLTPFTHQAQTKLDGRFTAKVIEDAPWVRLTVLPPGRAFQTFRIQPTDEEIVLKVPEMGGTLEVTWAASDAEDAPRSQLVILKEGEVLPNGWLFRWARGHGEDFLTGLEAGAARIPQLAAGNYLVCQPTVEAMRRKALEEGDWRGALTDCVAGYLGAGSVLHLQAPAP